MEHVITVTKSGVVSSFMDTPKQKRLLKQYVDALLGQGLEFTYTVLKP